MSSSLPNQMRALSDQDILRYYKSNPRFGGVFLQKDFKSAKRGMFYVIDLGVANKMGHWVGLSLLDPKLIIFYDSFGVAPSIHIIKAIRGNKVSPRIWYNTIDEQGLAQSNCGERVLGFIDKQLKELGLQVKPKKVVGGKSMLGSGLPLELFG